MPELCEEHEMTETFKRRKTMEASEPSKQGATAPPKPFSVQEKIFSFFKPTKKNPNIAIEAYLSSDSDDQLKEVGLPPHPVA